MSFAVDSLLTLQTKAKATEEIRTEVCLMKDVRILEGIFHIFIRDEFTFVISLDLALAREVVISHIRYWCLNLAVCAIRFSFILLFYFYETWR
jgi:hypothetical protein